MSMCIKTQNRFTLRADHYLLLLNNEPTLCYPLDSVQRIFAERTLW